MVSNFKFTTIVSTEHICIRIFQLVVDIAVSFFILGIFLDEMTFSTIVVVATAAAAAAVTPITFILL